MGGCQQMRCLSWAYLLVSLAGRRASQAAPAKGLRRPSVYRRNLFLITILLAGTNSMAEPKEDAEELMNASTGFAEQMLEQMDEAEGFSNSAGTGQYSPTKGFRCETKFERRGLRLGHGVWDLIYTKD